MTIRFTCAGCGSLLKIKDDLAGTDGKCPKCKTEFVVPSPDSDSELAEVEAPAAHKEQQPEEPAPSKPESSKPSAVKKSPSEPETKPGKSAKPADKSKKAAQSSDDDFDPADFLMDDGDGGPKKPSRSIPARDDDESESRASDTRSNRPAPRPSSPASGGASTTSRPDGVSASAHAKEMMMKAMEDSRLHASDAPTEEKESGFDFAGMFRELGVKGIGGVLAVCVLGFGLYLFIDHMLGGALKLPPLGYVTGTVTLDGKPLAGASVYFEPKDAKINNKERPRTSLGTTDDKGHYTMFYIDKTQGVAVGKSRVWLNLLNEKGQQVIPPENTDGNLVVREVKSGAQVIDFTMTSPPEAAQN